MLVHQRVPTIPSHPIISSGNPRRNDWHLSGGIFYFFAQQLTNIDYAGLGKCPFLGILNITFKYLLVIISPIVGWCSIRTFTNPCYGGCMDYGGIPTKTWGACWSKSVNQLSKVSDRCCWLATMIEQKPKRRKSLPFHSTNDIYPQCVVCVNHHGGWMLMVSPKPAKPIYAPCMEYIYLHLPQKSPSFVGKYSSTMVRIWEMIAGELATCQPAWNFREVDGLDSPQGARMILQPGAVGIPKQPQYAPVNHWLTICDVIVSDS